jgi:hypothetical protein
MVQDDDDELLTVELPTKVRAWFRNYTASPAVLLRLSLEKIIRVEGIEVRLSDDFSTATITADTDIIDRFLEYEDAMDQLIVMALEEFAESRGFRLRSRAHRRPRAPKSNVVPLWRVA